MCQRLSWVHLLPGPECLRNGVGRRRGPSWARLGCHRVNRLCLINANLICVWALTLALPTIIPAFTLQLDCSVSVITLYQSKRLHLMLKLWLLILQIYLQRSLRKQEAGHKTQPWNLCSVRWVPAESCLIWLREPPQNKIMWPTQSSSPTVKWGNGAVVATLSIHFQVLSAQSWYVCVSQWIRSPFCRFIATSVPRALWTKLVQN